METLGNVLRGKLTFIPRKWAKVSKEAKDLIRKLICKADNRITAHTALDHPWFKKMLSNEPTAVPRVNSTNLDALRAFNKNTQMKKVALTAISVQASPDDIKDLKDLFLKLDEDGNGTLTMKELETGLQGREDAAKIMELMKSADTDGSGDINYNEFLAATMEANIYLRDDYLKTAFRMFDKDNSGTIDNEEVRALLQGDDLSNLVSKEAIAQAMAEIDENGDGEIDF